MKFARLNPKKRKNKLSRYTMPKLQCPSCRGEITPDSIYCDQCGIRLPVAIFSKIDRNDPCRCGSGKKYKHCHLAEDEAHLQEIKSGESNLKYTELKEVMSTTDLSEICLAKSLLIKEKIPFLAQGEKYSQLEGRIPVRFMVAEHLVNKAKKALKNLL